jgi:hypothetical protein
MIFRFVLDDFCVKDPFFSQILQKVKMEECNEFWWGRDSKFGWSRLSDNLVRTCLDYLNFMDLTHENLWFHSVCPGKN